LDFDEKQTQEVQEEVLTKFDEMNTQFWVVRAGVNGKEEKGALENNLVTIE
jgi:hypothetical protein